MIPIYKPFIPSQSIEYVNDALQSSWISSIGKYLDLTSEKIAEILGCKYVILTNTGTSATHLTVRCLERFYPETQRVIVPSACYIAAYNSLLYDKFDWRIVASDLDKETWNMMPYDTKEGDALMIVHNLGNIINVPELKRKTKCPIIEDNCEGFFGTYENKQAGTESLCSSLSFFGNKNITCGEGGAFLTNDKDVYDFANKLRGQGQTDQKYIHDELGYNYRMTNVQAAILYGQLKEIEYIEYSKKRVFNKYRDNLYDCNELKLQSVTPNTAHSMWMIGVLINKSESYEKLRGMFSDHGIDTRPMFYPYNVHKHLSDITGPCTNSISLNKKIVILPSYPTLQDHQIDKICEATRTIAKRI